MLDSRKGAVRVRVTDCHGFDDRVWDDLIGSAFALAEISGGRRPAVKVLEESKDHSMRELHFTWRR